MRLYLIAAAAFALAGCHAAVPQNAKSASQANAPPSPGRVVVYRNGVAYVERFADVENGTLSLAVSRDKVDDLLKSLTAVDAATGEPVPVAYAPSSDDSVLMLQVGGKSAQKRRLKLTYVTGAPAWKPSYRVVVGKTGDVELQSWAIVDNASGEDWKDVRLGVGASSALSFKFDMKGLRVVERSEMDDNSLQFARSNTAMAQGGKSKADQAPAPPQGVPVPPSTDPIGTSHFESPTPMTVPKGTSAMVSILKSGTEGEVVYLYDPQNPKADARFPFRTLRFRNPSDGALEAGPVSVFGDGRFVGEGLAEPVPAKSIAFVPFALDRQVSVEQKLSTHDEITKIAGVSHGVLTTDQAHLQKKTYVLTNRMGEKTTVYVKHTVTNGYKLVKYPDTRSPAPGATDSSDHLADTSMFKVELEPNGHAEIEIEESTPMHRVMDIRSPGSLELVRAFLSSEAAPNGLKTHIDELMKVSNDIAKTQDQINIEQSSIAEEQTRIDEIKNQLATLKAVKGGNTLATGLEKKLAELVATVSKQTVELVALQQKLMVAQVELQTAVADTTLERTPAPTLVAPSPPAPPVAPSMKQARSGP
jgi:hypothetical protein